MRRRFSVVSEYKRNRVYGFFFFVKIKLFHGMECSTMMAKCHSAKELG